jgi:3-hydroxyisobutyrate dehydrogenase-like beta-hydroxyacid dehydrogenase
VAAPADVGRASEVVGVCVWDEHDVDAVLLGETGVLAGMKPGGVVAVHSTISPAACRRLQDEGAARGIGVLDAPVSVGSRLPKLLVMVGGEADAVDKAKPVLDTFGEPVLHLGPIGSGQVAKLVNNTLLAATCGLADDAIGLGAALGLDPQALTAALSAGSSGGTWSSLLASRGGRLAAEQGGRTHEWASKDVGLTLDLAAGADLDTHREVLRVARLGVEVLG